LVPHFRGYTATAPLKLRGFRVRFVDADVAFPWLHSHGPIEAGKSLAAEHYLVLISVATQPRPH